MNREERKDQVRATRRAIARYGKEGCLRAFSLNENEGEGPASIVAYYNIHNVTTIAAANAAINAGRAISEAHDAAMLALVRAAQF